MSSEYLEKYKWRKPWVTNRVLATAQEKNMSHGARHALKKKKNLSFKNFAFRAPPHHKKLNLNISAEIAEKVRREAEPKYGFLIICRVLLCMYE